jgi:hypothetical protein
MFRPSQCWKKYTLLWWRTNPEIHNGEVENTTVKATFFVFEKTLKLTQIFNKIV